LAERSNLETLLHALILFYKKADPKESRPEMDSTTLLSLFEVSGAKMQKVLEGPAKTQWR
jgi:hypothetical protein